MGTINMFSQWRQNGKSLYFKVLTLSHLLLLTFQFATSYWSCLKYYISLLLTVLDINLRQIEYSKKLSLYFLNWFICKLFLHCLPSTSAKSGWKCGWERIQLVNMPAVFIASKIKQTDVYHKDINYNCLYLLYYTYNKHCNQYGLLLTVLQDTMQIIHTMCI